MPTVKHKKKRILIGRHPLNYALYGLYFILITMFIGYHLYFADKVIWRVLVNDRNFSGLTAQESIDKVRAEFPSDASIKIVIGDSYERVVAFEDIGFEYLPIDTTYRAFGFGRERNFIESLQSKSKAIFSGANIDPAYKYDEAKSEILLTQIKKEAGLIAQETHFEIVEGELVVVEGTTGKSFDDVSTRDKIVEGFVSENFAPINEPLFEIRPQLTLDDLNKVRPQLEEYLDIGYVFKYQNQEWQLTPEEIVEIFEVSKDQNGSVTLVINDMSIAAKLSSIAKELDRNPRGQILEVESGKAIKFVSSEDGLRLKIKESSEETKKNLLAKTKDIPLLVQIATAPETENEFGIKELLAEGSSKFKGSIPGRIHNIGLASSRVNGILVPPGENFSFVDSIGEISRTTGYTSAYVISAGRTVLGDGGGVCQVSTTVFRAALNAGLPIVERNPHSYRVGYYEQDSPPGIDAAVYTPTVDLQFKNDTPGYILITSEFNAETASLVYKIYGTKDGREVEVSEPKIHSRTPPPEPLYEEDGSLAKGQTQQVESAVWGASVSFGRIVKKDGVVVSDDTFKSNYRAWRAIYKVGTRE